MKKCFLLGTVAVGVLALGAGARAEDLVARVKKAVERSTLDQPGTKPFHLKAELAPSFERDKASGRTGEVEIWWESPTRWRREVRSSDFHQIEVVDGGRDWQTNEGDYFPEWLREMAVALVKPVPDLDSVLERVKTGEVRPIGNAVHISWVTIGTDGTVSKGIGQGIDLENGGPLFGFGQGWNASLHDPQDFHGRQIARTVTGGGPGPEIAARVTVLEDLKGAASDLFQIPASEGDPLLRTKVVSELEMRRNLLPQNISAWPSVEQGPLDGVLTGEVVIDRKGTVRDIGSILSDNPGLIESARERIKAMRFKPYVADGLPVQVVTTLTMPFKTTRPTGMENFDSARNYFEKGRSVGFPAAGKGPGYTIRAEFETRTSSGSVENGIYTDTWLSDRQWRREAVVGKSRYVRSRNGDKRYQFGEGPDAALLRAVLAVMEPIPAIDTFVESDWRVKREQVNGTATVRVASGYEAPDGTPDAVHFRGYWFDDSGQLVKAYANGWEVRRSDWADLNGVRVAQRVDVLSGGKLGMRVQIKELGPTGAVDPQIFIVKGHEWVRQFTAEVR